MKNLLLGLMMLFALSAFAQSTHTVDFETPGVGADWVWTVAENSDNPPLQFIANPVSGGINTSPTVAKFTARLAGNPWALCFTSGDGAFTFDASNAIVKIMVYKAVISDVGFKVEGAGPATQLVVANTLINQWEELTFNFSSVIGQSYSTLVIIPDFDFTPRSQENIIYFDNIQVPDGVPAGPLTEPTVAAPTPTQNPGDVISMFSDVYSNVPVDTWLTGWSQGVLEDVLIAGNPTKKYSSVTFVGIETTGANLINATTMTHFHIDVWSPDANDFKIKLVDFGANATYGGGDDTEHEITFPAPATETWISYDIPLTDFTSLASREHLAQLIMVKAPLGTIFIDNVFYYYEDVTITEPVVAAPTPTQNPGNVISMFSDAYTDVSVDTWLTVWSQGVLEDIFIAGNPTKKYSALNFVGIETTGANLINASSMTHFHIDVWSPDANDFKIKLVDFGADAAWGGGDDTEHELTFVAPTPNTWISYDIPLSNFTGLASREHLAQLIMVKAPLGTIFVDNVFYYFQVVIPTEPFVAAPTPTAGAADVISIYSDAYVNVPGTNFYPNWGQSTIVTVNYLVADDNTLKYANLNYQGTELAAAINVSGYEYLHVDFWTANSTQLNFFLISPGPVQTAYALPITPAVWVSVNIPLSAFSPVDLTNVFQMMVTGNGDIWFDNLYFWKSPAATVWNGSANNNWHNALNWSNGIPGASTDVTIPSGLSNYPTINSAASCKNLLLNSAYGSTATLIDNGNLTIFGNASVERYFSGNDIDWHLVSSPVSNATAGVFTGMYLQNFDHTTYTYTDIINEATPLNVMEGYALYSTLGSANTVTFTGNLNTGIQSAPINLGADSYNWNLLGNPFASSIDWEEVSIPANMTNEVHFIDAATGNDLSYVQGNLGTARYIPPMQGFFVSATGADALQFADDVRTHSGSGNFYKNDNPQLVILEAIGENFTDETWIHFNDLAGAEHDGQFDAYKRISLSNPELPQIFSYTPAGVELSINGMPEVQNIPVGFTALESGVYTINAKETGDFTELYLEDLFNGNVINLLENDYLFSYSAGDSPNRFVLHFSPLYISDQETSKINISSFNKEVIVQVPELSDGTIKVFNLLGQELVSVSMKNAINKITLSETGYYLVVVTNDDNVVTGKVFIQ